MEPPSFYKRSDRPALITPSASPPPLRVNVPPFLSHRGSSPPLKRQRMQSSTPLRAVRDGSSSSRTQTPVIDIQKEREASRSRLLDVWSSLAERYTRHLDEDDIVDLRTGKITKDNGVIRGSRPVAFGALAASGAGYQTVDEGSEEDEDERDDKDAEEDEAEDDEYGLDELDAFANPEDYGLETPDEVPVNIMVPPPTLPFGPTDEADLQEFMNAERMRRDTCGTDVEDTEDAGEEEETDFDHDHTGASEEEYFSVPSSDFVEDEVEEDGEEEEKGSTSALHEDYYDHIAPVRYDSEEDELGDWKDDDSNFTRPVSAPPEEILAEGDDEVEFIEAPDPPKKAVQARSTQNPSSASKLLQKKKQQLFTPPLSSSSYACSETPEPVGVSSKLPFRSSSRSANELKKSARSTEVEQSPVQELCVEPSARRESSKSRHESRSPSKSQHQSPTKPLTSVDLSRRPKPFVLLTPRNSASTKKAATVTRTPNDVESVEDNASANSSHTNLYKGKGKEKAKKESSSPTKQLWPLQDDSRGSSSPTKRKARHDSPESFVSYRESSGPPSSPTKKPSRTPFDEPRNDKRRLSPSGSSAPPSQPRASSSRDLLQHSSTSRNDAGEERYADTSLYGPSPPPPTKKRKRVVSDAKSHSSDHEKHSERHEAVEQKRGRSRSSHRTSDVTDSVHSSSQKRSGSRRRHAMFETESDCEHVSSSPSASESPSKHQRHRSHSRARSQLPQYHPPPPAPYGDSQPFPVSLSSLSSHPPPHSHSQPPSHLLEYTPVPDPRAQLIIAHAMHQLSALIGGTWPQPPYSDSYTPHTPSSHRHRHQRSRPSSQMSLPPLDSYITPSHRRPPETYYDPNFSYATAPPDSPEVDSSPNKPSPPQARRKAIVGRSRSRGRRVSFHFDEDSQTREREALQQSSPTRAPSKRSGKSGGSNGARREYSDSDVEEEQRAGRRTSAKGKGKEKSKARADTPAHGYVSASASRIGSYSEGDSDHEHEREYEHHHQRGYSRGHSQQKVQPGVQYVRGQTPGPDFESSYTTSHMPSGPSSRRQSSRSRR